MKKYILLLGVFSMIFLSACANQQIQNLQPNLQQPPEVQPQDTEQDNEEVEVNPGEIPELQEEGLVDGSKIKEFSMIAKRWDFEPATITVNEGDTVRLNIESTDATHGFALFEFGVNQRLNPGKKETVEFVADKAGEYTFFCSVPCGSGHKDMKGTLIVN
jgi:nitrosocyanin